MENKKEIIDEDELKDEFVDDSEKINPEDILQEYEIDKNEKFDEDLNMDMDIEEDIQKDNNIEYNQEFPNFKAPGEIYSIALDEEKGIAIIGDGEENTIIFDIQKKEIIKQYHLNKDSINFIKFTFDHKYLITASIDGSIHIFDPNNDYNLLDTFEDQDSEIQWLDIHPKGPCFAFGTSEGAVWVYILNNNKDNFSFFSHQSSCTCGAFINQGKNLISVSDDLTCKIYDLKNQNVISTIKGNQFHKSPIISLSIASNKHLAATGSETGEISLINYDNGYVLYYNQSFDGDNVGIETINFCNDDKYICFSNTNSKFFIFDLDCLNIRSIIKLENENIIKSINSHLNNFELFCSGDNGNFYVIDIRGNGSISVKEKCHKDLILDFVITKNEKFILTSSLDKTLNLVKIVTLD